MKNALVLLLVVLFVSLPSVVFAQPPLRAVQSGETSQAASTTEAVKKSWEGPLFGFGLGLGYASEEVSVLGETLVGATGGIMPVQIRLGYGFSDRTVLYGSVLGLRSLASEGEWGEPGGFLGMMFRGRARRSDRLASPYGFGSLGASFSGDPVRTYGFRGGYGVEVYPGLSLEGAGMFLYAGGEGVAVNGYSFDLTFNYHFY